MKCLLLAFCIYATTISAAKGETWYVQAGSNANGDGSETLPFNSLQEVENRSQPGDKIFVLPSSLALDGGIRLKDEQQLIGLGPEVTEVSTELPHARITNSTGALLNGDAIRLANRNTVKNIHITKAFRSGILGINVVASKIRNNLITENLIQNNDLAVLQNNFVIFQRQRNHFGAITLFACGAASTNQCLQQDPKTQGIANTGEVTIEGNEIRNSNVEGIVLLNDTSVVANYKVKDNDVRDLSLTLPAPETVGITEIVRSRAFTLLAGNGARVTLKMDNLTASNLAPNGNYASDGVVLVTFGANVYVGAEISDLVVSNPNLTGELANGDSLEFTHFGNNSTFDVSVKRARLSDAVNSQIKLLESGNSTQKNFQNNFRIQVTDSVLTNANPRSALPQARGAISYGKVGDTESLPLNTLDLIVRRTSMSGIGRGIYILNSVPANTVNVLVEKSSLSNLTQEGFFFSNTGAGTINSANIDLGGGALASAGRNSFTNNGSSGVSITNNSATLIDVFAAESFWGGGSPVIGTDVNLAGQVNFIAPTFLTTAPKP